MRRRIALDLGSGLAWLAGSTLGPALAVAYWALALAAVGIGALRIVAWLPPAPRLLVISTVLRAVYASIRRRIARAAVAVISSSRST